jgi:hypothetical protein
LVAIVLQMLVLPVAALLLAKAFDLTTPYAVGLMLLAAAFPRLPSELERARIILSLEFEEHGLIGILFLIAVFIGVGFACAWAYWYFTTGFRNWIIATEIVTVGDRLRAMVARLAFGTGWALSFAIGSIGAFLCFSWPPLLREIVLGYLVAFLCVWLARIVGRFLLSAGGGPAARFRIVPMSDAAAKFWQRRLVMAVGVLAFAWVTIGLLKTLGVSPAGLLIISYVASTFLLILGLETIWRAPVDEDETAAPRRLSRRVRGLIASGLLILMWLLWSLYLMPGFALVVIGSAHQICEIVVFEKALSADGVFREMVREMFPEMAGLTHRELGKLGRETTTAPAAGASR